MGERPDVPVVGWTHPLAGVDVARTAHELRRSRVDRASDDRR